MARSYAVCLGLIAFVISIARGVILAESPESALPRSLAMMLAFAPIGYVLGWLTEALVRQSVEVNFRNAVKIAQEKHTSQG